MLEIRMMTREDAPAVAELGPQLGYDTNSSSVERAIARATESRSIVVVAVIGAGVAGWVHGYETVLMQYPHPFVEIGGLVVDRDTRGVGIGRALLGAVEEWAETQGVHEIRLRSNTVRHDAHGFYERLGYTNEKSSFTFSKRLR